MTIQQGDHYSGVTVVGGFIYFFGHKGKFQFQFRGVSDNSCDKSASIAGDKTKERTS